MATPVSGQPVQTNSGDQLSQLSNLLATLFGSKTTQTGTADTSALTALLSQLQGQDYTQLLNSIFAQAGGQIPGMQAAYSNAVGARSGSNSAVQANLERLMQQTALLGQQQVVQQQQANQQLQGQVAGNIANATRGAVTKQAGQAKSLAGTLALAQAALKLTGANNFEEMWKKMNGGSPAASMRGSNGAVMGNLAPLSMGPVQSVDGALAPLDSSFDMYLANSSMPLELGGTVGAAPSFGEVGGMVPGDAYQPGYQINNPVLDLGVPGYAAGDMYQPGATQGFDDLNLDEFLVGNPVYDF